MALFSGFLFAATQKAAAIAASLWFTTTTVKLKKCVRSSHSGLVMREMLDGSEECVDCKLNFNTTSSK